MMNVPVKNQMLYNKRTPFGDHFRVSFCPLVDIFLSHFRYIYSSSSSLCSSFRRRGGFEDSFCARCLRLVLSFFLSLLAAFEKSARLREHDARKRVCL